MLDVVLTGWGCQQGKHVTCFPHEAGSYEGKTHAARLLHTKNNIISARLMFNKSIKIQHDNRSDIEFARNKRTKTQHKNKQLNDQ